MRSDHWPKRILFVFAWLVVGGEETEVRLLAQNLDRRRYTLEVVPCFHKPNMPEQTIAQLAALGVPVDKTPYHLSFADTVTYLTRKIPAYDLVVACQAAPDVYPALERLTQRPPLIEHGGLVEEALRGPKHLTTRYVGVCDTICQAARSQMPTRPHHVLAIPSMVDLSEFDRRHRAAVRREWGVDDAITMIGWVGRLDRKKRVEDFIRAAALLHATHPATRFVVIGGPDAFMPEYADELQALAHDLKLAGILRFLGDRADVPRLLSGLDIFAWLSQGEGMPHVIAEAGAAGLPVVATCDNGAAEQITHGQTGLFVPYGAPAEVATTLAWLVRDPALRRRLGDNLRRKVEQEYSATVVTRRWEALFDELLTETTWAQELRHSPGVLVR
ncbi:MAG: glycosyltransferase family 1 protein [Caldilinea sp. CFX5]|nr:glycosyltransferase family 1 protein [Caldilinea sp. CFX5]